MNGEAEAGENVDWVKTENVYYINNNVTSISVTAAVEDAVAGLAEQYLCYSIGDGNKTAVTTSPLTIDVSTISDLTEYKIFAVDKVGNYSENLGSIKIKKHITAPVVSQTSAPPYSGIDFVPQYNGANILAIAGDHEILKGDPKTSYEPTRVEDTGTTIYGWKEGRPSGTETTSGYIIRKVEANSTLSLPVTGLPNNQVYCALTYNSVIEPTAWGDLYTVNNGNISGVPVDISMLDKRFMFIFVWYKDQLGNVSVYNLTCPQATGQNWWTSESGKDNKNVGDNGIFYIEVPGTPNVNASIARIGKAGAALVQTAKAFFGGKAQDYVDFPASSVTNQLMTKEISEAVVAEKPVKKAKSAGKAKSSKSQTKAEKFVPEIVKEIASTVVEQAPSVVEEKRLEEVVTKVEAEIKKVELSAVDSIIEAPKVIAPVQVVEEAAAVDLGVKPAVVYEEPVEDGNLIHWIIIALVLCCGLAGLIYLLVSKNAKKNK